METSTAKNIIMRAIVVVLCVVIALGMGAVTVSAAGNHGRAASHTEDIYLFGLVDSVSGRVEHIP